MIEAKVFRTNEFKSSLSKLLCGNDLEAYSDLSSLRDQYNDDQHSKIEIDRWRARALMRLQRSKEALDLLLQLEPLLQEFEYDMSVHHSMVTSLLKELGRLKDIRTYCEQLSYHVKTEDTLSHLEWITDYAMSHDDAIPTPFMTKILTTCATQLGTPLPADWCMADRFPPTCQRLLAVRKSANDRYGAFWLQYNHLSAIASPREVIATHINSFVNSEPCPRFQDMARAINVGEEKVSRPNGTS